MKSFTSNNLKLTHIQWWLITDELWSFKITRQIIDFLSSTKIFCISYRTWFFVSLPKMNAAVRTLLLCCRRKISSFLLSSPFHDLIKEIDILRWEHAWWYLHCPKGKVFSIGTCSFLLVTMFTVHKDSKCATSRLEVFLWLLPPLLFL